MPPAHFEISAQSFTDSKIPLILSSLTDKRKQEDNWDGQFHY